jgi:hypothetical protein
MIVRVQVSIWDKMAVAEGTDEQRKGFDFVATVKSNNGDSSVFPYSVTSGGITS